MTLPDLFMVFDVESVGLHGEGFAAGFVVIDPQGKWVDEGRLVSDSRAARGTLSDHQWVETYVPLNCRYSPTAITARDVRDHFWGRWTAWKASGAVLVADCGWPVEARFLLAAVDDAPATRRLCGPYPFHELASFLMAAGMDPLATYDRLESERPVHDPLSDSRQSARLLSEALAKLRAAANG